MPLLLILLILWTSSSKAEMTSYEQGGMGNSTGIIEPFHLQIENTTLNYNNRSEKNQDLFGLSSTLFRYGILKDRLEVRTQVSGLTLFNDRANLDRIDVGVKLGLIKQKLILPTTNIIVNFSIPVDDAWSNIGFENFYKLLMDYDLPMNHKAYVNMALDLTNLDRINQETITATQMPYVIGIKKALSDKSSIGYEVFGTMSLSGLDNSTLGTGVKYGYQINDNTAATATMLFGLNEAADDFSVNAGFVKFF